VVRRSRREPELVRERNGGIRIVYNGSKYTITGHLRKRVVMGVERINDFLEAA
jgi:hypothetical protein